MKHIGEEHRGQVEETLLYLREKLSVLPEIILVLGTGLGSLATHIEVDARLPYEDIPHFPQSTVTGHSGNLIAGKLCGKPIAALQGRFHFYEGYSARELTFPVRVLSLLGAKFLFVSNASGGLNPDYAPGTLMVIRDHLNFIPDNPLRGPNEDAWGPRFPDCSQVYDSDCVNLAIQCAHNENIGDVVSGTYVAVPGPSLETPAETRFLRMCGADAVGMSTVPEVLVAVHAGLKIFGISMVVNVNDPDNFQPILIEDVLSEVKKAEDRFVRLVMAILKFF